ncbi:molybdopterin-dependent oxidoreductase [Paenibacillus pinistramenti]|uniref:molybdopterin-dependent oxidoreductase n=1 Tax=Paenibacillus pinistramenti TaxID=1768003 RepID=UPI001108BA6F|nr:molybdopterin-dependent oxidoreductase [Paenibacillus pinistramenti]
MAQWLAKIRKGYGRKLRHLHSWNAWIVLILAISGLILISGYWRERLGEGRVWIKWIHIYAGLLLIAPVAYYLLLAGKHWKQLRSRPKQKANVIVILLLLAGWILSGVILWQLKLFGPSWTNPALRIHDLLTWIGLPYIIYHSVTRIKWLKEEPERRAIKNDTPAKLGLEDERPLYSRRVFLKWSLAGILAVVFGPPLLKWIGKDLWKTDTIEDLIANDANRMVPPPKPSPQSLPPVGGGAKGEFRVYTVTEIPAFDNATWSLTIDGLVEKKIHWNWEQFLQQQRTVQVSDFHCVTGWSVYQNTWEGIQLKQLLKMAGVKDEAKFVKFYSGDEVYTDCLSLQQANYDDMMVAVLHDGQPIPSDLGGPVRLITPKMYAYKSVKWLNRIELIAEEHIGYWEQRGYDKDAWVSTKGATET